MLEGRPGVQRNEFSSIYIESRLLYVAAAAAAAVLGDHLAVEDGVGVAVRVVKDARSSECWGAVELHGWFAAVSRWHGTSAPRLLTAIIIIIVVVVVVVVVVMAAVVVVIWIIIIIMVVVSVIVVMVVL